MITDKDVKKLKNVFTTKEDIEKMKDVFATKEDLEKMKKVFATKEDIKILSKDIHIVINMIGESLNQNKEQDDILENHETRLDKVEDKVFSTI